MAWLPILRFPVLFSGFNCINQYIESQGLHREKKEDNNVVIVSKPAQLEFAKELIKEYMESLEFSLDFENIENELETLKLHYGPPTGVIILAKSNGKFVGCTCVRNLGEFTAEIKRMYVQPNYRGGGLGRAMLRKAIDEAKWLGYRYLRLDTVPDMESAIYLYKSTGFYEIEDYTYNPIPGARFMEYKL